MKPTKQEIENHYRYNKRGFLEYRNDAKRGKPVKAGDRAGSDSAQGIRMVSLLGKYYQEHQLIWTMFRGTWPSRPMRHVNGDLSDNRIENLSMDSLKRGKVSGPLSAERLREMISYNPDTGEMVWKVSPRNRTMPGDAVGYEIDSGYLVTVVDQKRIRLHRAAWAIHYGEMPKGEIDHINGDRKDNRISNLRIVSRSGNSQNTAIRSDNKTGAKGVHFRKDTGKFSASIRVDGKTTYLGCYHSFEEAAEARLSAEKKLHPYRRIAN